MSAVDQQRKSKERRIENIRRRLDDTISYAPSSEAARIAGVIKAILDLLADEL